MKQVFKMVDLDCANCAMKMERAIAKIKGVESVRVDFFAQRLTIEADDQNFDAIVKQAAKACKKIEPDCEIVLK